MARRVSGKDILLPAIIILVLSIPAEGRTYVDSDTAVKVILGEAADQGLEGMIAVAEVIRNRGSVRGFSSTRRDLDRFARQQPEEVKAHAREAWRLSLKTNYTQGATHFDNVVRFGMPHWAGGMVRTATIGDMTYFREAG